MRKAVDAGQDPTTIPLPNTPGFSAWVNTQKLAGMDSSKRAEFTEKVADIKARRDEQMQIHEDNNALKRIQMQQAKEKQEEQLKGASKREFVEPGRN